jgi:hypothetical protein
MIVCAILYNMIIESEHETPVFDTEPYYRQGPLTDIDHQVPHVFASFLARRQEVRDINTHSQLQDDMMEHLWRLKGAR